jgi:5-methyltetrahydropteroyltriglutamate--homocysteine methyltransferase
MTNNQPSGNEILRTTVVGSYPQPDWLINKQILRSQLVPRVRQENLWRIAPELRTEAIRDAALIAIGDMEAADIDVITDGEVARESYSNHFIGALEGVDDRNPATITSRTGHQTRVPRIVGPVRHRVPAEMEFARFLREHTRRRAKVTLPGPFTLAQQSHDEHYRDVEALAFDFAVALNTEARLLETTGIDVIQLDEPWLRNDPGAARRFAVPLLNRALQGLKVRTAVHTCFGYAFLRPDDQESRSYEFLTELADCVADEISVEAAKPKLDPAVLAGLSGKAIAVGVLDHSTAEAEPAETVAERIRAALRYVSPEKLLPAPDCGMKYMTRPVAFARLRSLAVAAQQVRRELTGQPG